MLSMDLRYQAYTPKALLKAYTERRCNRHITEILGTSLSTLSIHYSLMRKIPAETATDHKKNVYLVNKVGIGMFETGMLCQLRNTQVERPILRKRLNLKDGFVDKQSLKSLGTRILNLPYVEVYTGSAKSLCLQYTMNSAGNAMVLYDNTELK